MTTTEIAHLYLGNYLEDLQLQQQVDAARSSEACFEVKLTQADRTKSRIYAKTSSDTSVGIVKERDWLLREGDVFQTERDRILVVHLETQQLLVLSLSEGCIESSLKLIHLGHMLGNHHYPILVEPNKIYVQLNVDRSLIEVAIRSFDIPGLNISYEVRSPTHYLNFSNHHLTHSHHP